jgi:acetyltransferase
VTAEFDVMIRSDLKGHGFGYALMSALISEARARGLAEIFGYILMENHPMLQMVDELGFKTERIAGGVAEVKLTMNA